MAQIFHLFLHGLVIWFAVRADILDFVAVKLG